MPDLVGHDRQPSAFIVYLALWRLTHGRADGATQIALLDIAEPTGLSKRAVQDALRWLSKRKLVSISRASITSVPVHTVLLTLETLAVLQSARSTRPMDRPSTPS